MPKEQLHVQEAQILLTPEPGIAQSAPPSTGLLDSIVGLGAASTASKDGSSGLGKFLNATSKVEASPAQMHCLNGE